MDSKARRTIIVERLRHEGEATIAEMAADYGTSEMTIRRDLELLELEGLARRVRGGAISIQARGFEPPVLQRSAEQAEAKRRIGAAAAAALRPNETIILDVGSTAHQLARAIPDDLAITALTSSLLIATELATKPLVRTIVTGGVVRQGEMSLVGARAVDSFVDLHCDAVFLGVAGISVEAGLTEYNLDDAEVKRAAIASGRRRIVLADASKIGRVALVSVAPANVIDVLITNAAPSNETIQRLRELDVEVIHVEPVEEESP